MTVLLPRSRALVLAALAATCALLLSAAPASAGSGATISAASSAAAAVDTVLSGDELDRGERIVSPDGAWIFVMQTDGNAVTYDVRGRATWSSGTQGRGDHLRMQTDGDAVISSSAGQAVWSTGTTDEPRARLTLQNDGNLVVYREDGTAAWASSVGTTIAPPSTTGIDSGATLRPGAELVSLGAHYRGAMQRDGNFVLYGPDGSYWDTRTSGAGNRLVMQGDGNLVVYRPDDTPAWSSGTAGSPGSRLELQQNGDLQILRPDGTVVWQTSSLILSDTFRSGYHYAGEHLVSTSGLWRAVVQQDGNFVVYGPPGAVWSTATSGPQAALLLDIDGWMSMMSSGIVQWNELPLHPDGATVRPVRLVMQNDGNLVEYDGLGRAVWASRGL